MVTNNGDANNLSGQGTPNPKLVIPNKNLMVPPTLSMALAIEQWCNNLVSPETTTSTGFPTLSGTGSPEGVVSASPPASYQDTTTGALYSKADGSGDTGWVVVGGNGSTAVPGLAADTSAGTFVTSTGAGVTVEDSGGGSIGVIATGGTGEVYIEAEAGIDMNAGNGRAVLQGNSVSILSTSGPSQIQMDHPTAGKLLLIGTEIGLYLAPAVSQPTAIASPVGGVVADVEARGAIDSILAALGQAAGGIGITA